MRRFFCANCGLELEIIRKAMPKHGTIIDLVSYHECLDEPVEPNLEKQEVPTFTQFSDKSKFVQKLNDLEPRPEGFPLQSNLQDRRAEGDVKSSAPDSILQNIRSMSNTAPAHDLDDSEDSEED